MKSHKNIKISFWKLQARKTALRAGLRFLSRQKSLPVVYRQAQRVKKADTLSDRQESLQDKEKTLQIHELTKA